MIGFATKRHLQRALHPDIAGDIPRLTDFVRNGAPEGVPVSDHNVPLPPPPIHNPNAHGLGTPMQGARIKAARRERLYGRVFKICIWAVLLASMFIVGRNTSAQRDAIQGTGIYYRMKAERLDPRQRLCEIDPHEGCLVCMHKDVGGVMVVSSHC